MTADEVWQRAVDVAQIVSAIATFATVVVAARLWTKQFKPRLKVSMAEVTLVNSMRSEDYVSIGVINTGLTPVIVSGLQYRPYKRYKQRWFQIPDYSNPLSAQMPLRLAPGETNQYLFSPDEWFDNAAGMIHGSYMKSVWVRLFWKRRFRVELLISTGESFPARPPRAMIERLDRELWAKMLEGAGM